jgi:hypothetical protein
VLVTGIQPTACSGVSFALDAGNKCRMTTNEAPETEHYVLQLRQQGKQWA